MLQRTSLEIRALNHRLSSIFPKGSINHTEIIPGQTIDIEVLPDDPAYALVRLSSDSDILYFALFPRVDPSKKAKVDMKVFMSLTMHEPNERLCDMKTVNKFRFSFDPRDVKHPKVKPGAHKVADVEREKLYICFLSSFGCKLGVRIRSNTKPTLPPTPKDIYLVHKNNLSFTEKLIEKHIQALQE